MRGSNIINPNDGLTVTPIRKVEEEWDDSNDAKDMEDASGVNLIFVDPTKDLSSTKVNAPPLLV